MKTLLRNRRIADTRLYVTPRSAKGIKKIIINALKITAERIKSNNDEP